MPVRSVLMKNDWRNNFLLPHSYHTQQKVTVRTIFDRRSAFYLFIVPRQAALSQALFSTLVPHQLTFFCCLHPSIRPPTNPPIGQARHMKRSGETCCASEAPAATGSACDSAAASIPSNPEHGSNKDTIASAGADPLNSTQSTRINPAPSSWPLSYESGAPKSDTVTAIDTVKTAATPAARQQQQRQGGGSQITGPLFSFGAIADVQYADRDDGWNYYKTHRRFYRGGLRQLRKAVDVWLREESHRFVCTMAMCHYTLLVWYTYQVLLPSFFFLGGGAWFVGFWACAWCVVLFSLYT